jgi:non-ribosomal peptide synthetase-like protein
VSCLHHLFEREVDLHPESPAIVCGDAAMSYAQVEERANQLARHLRSHGVGTGEIVGLMVERSPDAILAILSILKAGAAYLPLDPSHPPERIRHILAEASITTVVSEGKLGADALGVLDAAGASVVAIDDPCQPWQALSTMRLSVEQTGVAPSDLCYVLYTSGSTGRPKGVMAEHRSVVAFVDAFNDVIRLTDQDRVFQGFSLGFDGSVEEMWMAFSNGAALVVPERGAARFGDDLALLVAGGNVTVFSTVPTSLAMMTHALPSVRLLIVSGERCPPEAVARWATPGRRMLNVYGPTETTVNATIAECAPGQPVTIGRPLGGYGLHVLDEDGRPAARGDRGELYISGPCLARGYLGQRELTDERFGLLPAASGAAGTRAYRTGDLVSAGERGDLLFHGRLDTQVKVRGYRIELSEIESVLLEDAAIRAAAVMAIEGDGARDGTPTLAAYVIARDLAAGIDRNRLLANLGARLPAYMVPAFLDVLESFPTLPSGKVDRKQLPKPLAALARTDRTMRAPNDALEADLLATYARVLRNDAISIDDDFFLALGGYSLLAAQLVSELRKDLGIEVAIRDVYNHPTIAALAVHLRAKGAGERRAPARAPAANGHRVDGGETQPTIGPAARALRAVFAGAQALGLYLIYAVVALPYWGLHFTAAAWRHERLSLGSSIGLSLLVVTGVWPALLLLSIAAKWILIGRYRPGAYPLRSGYYLRFWLARRFQLISGSAFLAGTPFMALYLRAMGARIGRGCTISTAFFGAFDLLRIGDDTSIGVETQILGYRVQDGMLHIGSADIGSRCFIGTHAAVGLDAWMSDDARLDDQSLLPDRTRIPAGEARRGSPAQPAEVRLPTLAMARDRAPLRRRWAMLGALQLLALAAIFIALLPTVIPGWMLITLAEGTHRIGWMLAAIPAAGTLTIAVFCLWLVVLNHLLLPSVEPGVYRVDSLFYVRKWGSDLLMQLSRSIARPIYTTIYLPAWLRMMGARIGRRAEISTVSQMSPQLTRIGAQSFFADGSIVGGNRIHRGLLELRQSRIGHRSFVGNGAILPVGASLGNECLLGCLSAPPAAHMCTPDGTEWLGSPSFALPRRPRVGGFERAVTHEPTRKLITQRLLIDALRIVLPATIVTGFLVAFAALAAAARDRLPVGLWVASVPLIEIALSAAALLSVVAVKVTLIGTFVPTVQPLWSMFVWLNEALNGTYESVATPVLTLLLGTPFAAPWLRMLGCKIGRDVYLETTLFSEFDLVQVGHGAALNAGAVIQNHLFEDRIMKASFVQIGDRCTVGNMAVVLYDTEMKDGSTIGPLSLLMKGETVAPETSWLGIPTAEAARPAAMPPVAEAPVAAGAPPEVARDVAWLEQSL